MLEENLKSGTKSPAEVALNIMSFLSVELAAQSPSAEARFFQIFNMLCNRVFGPISLDGAKCDYRHENGIGWMSWIKRWPRPVSSSTASSARTRASGASPIRRIGSPSSSSRTSTLSSTKDDPVVLLLGAQTGSSSTSRSSSSSQQQRALTFLQALAMEAAHRPNVRYTFPFKGLPEPMQSDWLALIDNMMSGPPGGNIIGGQRQLQIQMGKNNNSPSTNSMALMGHLFRVGPLQQSELVQYYQTQKVKKGGGALMGQPVSPFMGMSSSSASSSASPFGSQSQQLTAGSSSSSSKTKDVPPTIQLSMLEYYLLVFLRYPLYRPTEVVKATSASTPSPSSTSSTGGSSSSNRRSTPYGEQVYEEILRSYILYYIPVRAFSGSFHGFETIKRPDELFIRLIISLWLEGQNRLSSTEAAITLFRQRRGDAAVAAGGVGLDKSFELVHGSYHPLPSTIVRALQRVIGHVIVDGAIADKARDISSGLSTSSSMSGPVLCLSPAMTMLQTPFYNYVRTVFRYESVHSSDSMKPTTFSDALDMWLCWLEPWNVSWKTQKSTTTTSRIAGKLSSPFKKSQSVSGKFNKPSWKSKSLYKPFWEPYIASNLHLYTVPLALFLRRAREFDFSPKKHKSSLDTVLRVLRVYTPEVVDVINRLLSSRSSSNNEMSPLYEFVKKHEENLGPYVPPVAGEWSLSSCGDDMQVLWDEITAQHKKKVERSYFGDQIPAYINMFYKFFTDIGAGAGENKELEIFAANAEILVGRDFSIPTSSNGTPSTSASGLGGKASSGSSDPARTEDGELSDIGRSSLLRGQDKCRVEDTEYFGDRIRALPQSNEIKILVTLTVQLSDYLNEKFQLDNVHSTIKPNTAAGRLVLWVLPNRINLRFLADWRNLWFIWFCLWLGKKCIF